VPITRVEAMEKYIFVLRRMVESKMGITKMPKRKSPGILHKIPMLENTK
jgi:hypothetical protein